MVRYCRYGCGAFALVAIFAGLVVGEGPKEAAAARPFASWTTVLRDNLRLYLEGRYGDVFANIKQATHALPPDVDCHRCLVLMRHALVGLSNQGEPVSEWNTWNKAARAEIDALQRKETLGVSDYVILAALADRGDEADKWLDKVLADAKSKWSDWALWEKGRRTALRLQSVGANGEDGLVDIVIDGVSHRTLGADQPAGEYRVRLGERLLQERPTSYMRGAFINDAVMFRQHEVMVAVDRLGTLTGLPEDVKKQNEEAMQKVIENIRTTAKLSGAESALDFVLWGSISTGREEIREYLKWDERAREGAGTTPATQQRD